jgi:hypothetical protein
VGAAADVAGGACLEDDALLGHEVDAALHDVLLVRLHVGHPVHHEPPDAVRALVHRHGVARLVEVRLLGFASRKR